MATITLAQHTARLITCLAEAVEFAQTTSPGTGHNAGMWQAASTEAQAALAQEADLAVMRGTEVRELRQQIDDLSTDEAITLLLNNATYLRLGAERYGPSDMTPAGLPASEMITTWAARFIAPLPAEVRELLLRADYLTARRAARLGAIETIQETADADLAPVMLDLLRRLLDLYDGQRLAPPETFASYWGEVRELISQAEEVG